METADSLFQDRLYTLGYALGLSILAVLAAYRLHFFRLFSKRRPEPPVLFRDLLGVFVLFVAIQGFLVPMGAYMWFAWQSGGLSQGSVFLTPSQQGWLNIIAIMATGVCLFIFLSRLGRPVFQSIGLAVNNLSEFVDAIRIGASSWLICYPLIVLIDTALALLITWLVPFPPAEQVAVQHLRASMKEPWLFAAMVILIIGIVPIIEEVLFRGFFQGWLRGFLGARGAILLSSLFFALFHYSASQGIGNIELLCSLFVLSLFLGFLYERQRSLWAPIALHMTFNTLSVIMILSNVSK